MRRASAALVVLATATFGRPAAAEPQIHGAVTAGSGYRVEAPFDDPGGAPFFVQLEAGFLLDPIQKFSHGASIAVPFAPGDGVVAIMPSYLLFRRPNLAYAYYGRLGYQLVLSPADGGGTDVANGLEVGLGFVWYVRAGLGLVAEADLDYVAGVDDAVVVGGHGGVAFGYEILP